MGRGGLRLLSACHSRKLPTGDYSQSHDEVEYSTLLHGLEDEEGALLDGDTGRLADELVGKAEGRAVCQRCALERILRAVDRKSRNRTAQRNE